MTTVICRECGIEVVAQRKSKRVCRECRLAYWRNYHERNKEHQQERRLAYSRAYNDDPRNKERRLEQYQASREERSAWSKEYRKTARYKEARAAYTERNKERIRAVHKAWRERNKDKIREQRAAYQERKKDELRERRLKRYQDNLEESRKKGRDHQTRRRARKLGSGGKISERDWKRLVNRYNGLCAYCGEPGTEQDHVVPLSRGGWHTIGNVLPACRKCNGNKSTRLLIEWPGRPRPLTRRGTPALDTTRNRDWDWNWSAA